MALDYFFKGISDGMDISKDAYDARVKAAKDELVLQGLYDTYGDNQVLRPDMLRNQQMQLDLDTAKRSASLDGLYRTHDLSTEAKNARSIYDRTNYDNLVEDINLWGQARRDSEKRRFESLEKQYDNNYKDIDMWGQQRRESELRRLEALKRQYDNSYFTEDLKGEINEKTRPTQLATGLNLVKTDNLVSQDKVFDAQTQVDINPDQWHTVVDGAKRLRIDARTGRVIAEETQPYVISKAKTDAIYGDQSATHNLEVLEATRGYDLETATNSALLKARDSQTQVAVRDVSLTVSGVPLDQQEALLEKIATTDKDPNKQIAAQSLLNEMRSQRATQQQIAAAGYVVLPDGKVQKVGGSSSGGTGGSGLTPVEKANLAAQEDAMKRINGLIASLTNDEDGFTEADKKLVEQAKIEMGLTGGTASGGTGGGTPTVSFTPQQEADYLEYGVRNLGWKFDQKAGVFYKPDGSAVNNGDVLTIRKQVDQANNRAIANGAMAYAIKKYGWKEDKAKKGWYTKDGTRVTPEMFSQMMNEYQSNKK